MEKGNQLRRGGQWEEEVEEWEEEGMEAAGMEVEIVAIEGAALQQHHNHQQL